MRAFLAIIKLTFRNSIRSHIFQLLLVILALCVVGIPSTVSGDGTAGGFIQVSLLYSLAAVSVVLALSSVWVGCFVMTQDIESYQIHMVVSKPVSRVTIWIGKYLSVLLMHAFLLLVSSLVIYFIIIAQFYRQDFPEAEKKRIENEVLVGRRVFRFTPPNIEEKSKQMLAERLSKVKESGETISITTRSEQDMLKEMRRMAIVEEAQVVPGQRMEWSFDGLPTENKQPLFLRYRTYVGKISTKDQRMTSGVWYIGVPQFEKNAKGEIIDKNKYQVFYYQYPEENIRSGEFYEKVLPSSMPVVTPDGKLFIAYDNLDPEKQTQYFQPSDGPKVLMKVTGFFDNYLRAVLVIFLEIVILAGLGCAFASVLSMPTAIFLSIAYLFFGSFASFWSEVATSGGATDTVARILSKILLLLVIPLQDFGVTQMVSKGELIEFSMIGSLFLFYFILRALPIFVLAIWLYRRRELGLVVRK